MTLSDLEPSADIKPSADKKPLAGKEPLADKEPSAIGEPSANTDSSVSWRLNELIHAGRKAKAFAKAKWSQPDAADSTLSSNFELWTPKVLDDQRDVDVAVVAEEAPDEGQAIEQISAEEAISEQPPEELEIESPAESFDQMALDKARNHSFDKGYKQGIDEAEAKWAGARDEFMAFTEALRTAHTEKNDFYQPLKKLALHLAEQLVRGELNQSTAVIERLLEEAIKDIEQQGEGPITVNLNASDHQQFTAHLSADLDHLSLRIDSSLSPGSVRITMDDSAVEDLIETRLSALSEKLLGLPEHRSAPRSVAKAYAAERPDLTETSATIIEGNAEELNLSDDTLESDIPDA
ncbi:FliH/SctL family protein [Porticoccaceae bacterium]|nr:FliH/SctL family protein [Porticoccaceae bacterium]